MEDKIPARGQILTVDIGKQMKPSYCTVIEGCMWRLGALKEDQPSQSQKFKASPEK